MPTTSVVSLATTGTVFTADGTYTFPSDVTRVRAFLWGAGGKNGGQVAGGQGGAGAYIAVDIPKGARTTLTVNMNKGAGSSGPGSGGAGGGYCSITTVADGIIALAGGGGGSGGGFFGGGGGFYNASQGGQTASLGTVSTSNNGFHGGGGSQSAGGSGGISRLNAAFYNGNAGSSLQGGSANGSTGYGGGGGGGYFGGGGGGGDANTPITPGMGAGGGGSSFVSAVGSNIEGQAGPNGATGGVYPGGLISSYYVSPYGASNQNGLVVIVAYVSTLQPLAMMQITQFTPLNVPGCQLWLDAADAATVIRSGSAVTQWNDKSGNGRNFTQTISGQRPTYGTFLSAPGVSFVGSSSQNLSNTYVQSGTGGRQTYLVFYDVSTAANQYGNPVMFYMADNNGAAGGDWRTAFDGANNYLAIDILAGAKVMNITPNVTAMRSQRTIGMWGAPTGATVNICYVYGNGRLFTNTVGSISLGTALNVVNTSLTRVGGGQTGYATFVLSELIHYSTELSIVQQQQVEGYLAYKWGIQANIPASNPFKANFFGYSSLPPVFRFNNTVPVSQTTVFLGTGSVQTFTVPAGVSAIRFFLWGAGGQAQNGTPDPIAGSFVNAGSGAYVEGNLLTTPGTTYQIIVGRPGVAGLANGAPGIGANTISGGGFSGIFSGSPAAGTVIAIAGGGGGSGYNANGNGGGGGYPSGLNSTNSGGQGGTQSAGGAASVSGGTAGSQLQGGNGVSGDNGGGGGGGGWYGGGGGSLQRAGGGGSSTYISSVINPVTVNGFVGVNTGTTTPTSAANESSPYWISPFGRTGRNGLVIIGYSTQTLSGIRFIPYPVAVSGLIKLTYTGAYSTIVVPSTATYMSVLMWGAGGSLTGDSTWWGGAGACVQGYLPVTAGETLRFIVGAGGSRNVTGDVNGAPGTGYAYGGGRTAVQRSIASVFTDVVVAGGGGGAGGGGTGNPGGGGAATSSGISFAGRSGNTNFLRQTANNGVAGGGGGQNVGGTGGSGNASGTGSKGQGGNSINNYSGGGGGGYYGGGGGIQNPNDHGSGGGGSSYVDLLVRFVGYDGSVNLTGNRSSPLWISPAGNGNSGSGSGDGLLYIQFFSSI